MVKGGGECIPAPPQGSEPIADADLRRVGADIGPGAIKIVKAMKRDLGRIAFNLIQIESNPRQASRRECYVLHLIG